MTKDTEIEIQFKDKMIAIMETLDEFMNGQVGGPDREVGIIVLIFPYGDKDGSRLNYISNGADRSDITTMFKEMIARFEGQPETHGTA